MAAPELAADPTSAPPPTMSPPSLSPDDLSVIDALDGGEPRRALALCARLHGRALGRVCMALVGSQADAEDLAQETLLEAYAAMRTWRREGSLRAFLMTIARRKCARHLEMRRRRGSKLRLVHDADRTPPSAPTERALLTRQRAARTRAALSTMRPSEREVVLLRYEAGLSFREVAATCGIEETAARKRVSRAVAKLRAALAEGDDR
ncbi:MAG: sigma-70 family RNA polymerase sigma factor [Myxococcota bacterium]